MGRASVIGPCLDGSARRKLAKELGRILPGSPEQHTAFLDEAELALDTYRKLIEPTHRDLDESFDVKLGVLARRARSFAKAATNPTTIEGVLARRARSFAKAVAALSPTAIDLLYCEYGLHYRRAGDDPPTSWNSAAASMNRMQVNAQEARLTAQIAETVRRNTSTKRTGPKGRGGVKRSAVGELIIDMARAYKNIFETRPSGENGGTFAIAQQEIRNAGGISEEIGHTRLKRILRSAPDIDGAPRPRRGPKVRSSRSKVPVSE